MKGESSSVFILQPWNLCFHNYVFWLDTADKIGLLRNFPTGTELLLFKIMKTVVQLRDVISRNNWNCRSAGKVCVIVPLVSYYKMAFHLRKTCLLLNSVYSKLEIEWTYTATWKQDFRHGIRWRALPVHRPRRTALIIMFLRRFDVVFQYY